MIKEAAENNRGFIKVVRNFSDDARNLDHFFHRVDENIRVNSTYRARVLLVAFSPKYLEELRDHLRGIGVHVNATTPNVKQLSHSGNMGAAFSHILVNFDAFDDLETGVDVLAAFRKRFDHAVVLCSEHVSYDDLGSERSAICDATLRLPISLERLQRGLRAASANSRERLPDWHAQALKRNI